MQGIYIIGVGQLLQHQDFQRRMEGKQTAFWGGFSIYQSSYYFAKNKGFYGAPAVPCGK